MFVNKRDRLLSAIDRGLGGPKRTVASNLIICTHVLLLSSQCIRLELVEAAHVSERYNVLIVLLNENDVTCYMCLRIYVYKLII